MPGALTGGETPGPIPNPEVKTSRADDTAVARLWESRSAPGIFIFCSAKEEGHGSSIDDLWPFLFLWPKSRKACPQDLLLSDKKTNVGSRQRLKVPLS